ncbi:glutamine synthetase family protein [Desulfoscipio gibsoniae]|uniref:glutamine synthetase n=1 Tax=Desulfoscipio gibsoniae DSM 7213 TaxID=767817 RepID=R4KRQ9_9FIRM|nr:glutamine synthetase family protein [Desulfoscipio gibsoniae]AGL02291.1 glutamine synthetase [Desulfoscipio gibsoniae DSM 7213]
MESTVLKMISTNGIDPSTGYKNLTVDDVKRLINDRGIEMIRLEYVDLNGVNRGKLLPADMIDVVFEDGIAFAAAIMAICFDNSVAQVKGLSEYYDDMKVLGDPTTFTILPYLDKTALLLGDLYYHQKPMRQSPRWFLKNMIKQYNDMGYNPITASEIEFFLYNKVENGDILPYTRQTGNAYTSNIRTDPQGFLNKLTRTFKEMDFKVLYMNHEFYPGQYEYNWSHSPALRNADETSLFKGICKDIAEQNNLFATFMAKPKNADGGSGCHFHISLNDLKMGQNIFYDQNDPDGTSKVLRNFVAGILKHARALTAFLAPTVNCFKRFQPDTFAPYYIGWGNDNRTTYVRIPEERGKATRAEIRAGSAACNPYLALAGILAAGLDGITNNLEPPEIVDSDLYHDAARQTEIVPKSLYRALAELEKDEWLCRCAGEELINNFIAVKQMEVEKFTNFVTDWEWQNYSYHV